MGQRAYDIVYLDLLAVGAAMGVIMTFPLSGGLVSETSVVCRSHNLHHYIQLKGLILPPLSHIILI